jgi:hypothetical protein
MDFKGEQETALLDGNDINANLDGSQQNYYNVNATQGSGDDGQQ